MVVVEVESVVGVGDDVGGGDEEGVLLQLQKRRGRFW